MSEETLLRKRCEKGNHEVDRINRASSHGPLISLRTIMKHHFGIRSTYFLYRWIHISQNGHTKVMNSTHNTYMVKMALEMVYSRDTVAAVRESVKNTDHMSDLLLRKGDEYNELSTNLRHIPSSISGGSERERTTPLPAASDQIRAGSTAGGMRGARTQKWLRSWIASRDTCRSDEQDGSKSYLMLVLELEP